MLRFLGVGPFFSRHRRGQQKERRVSQNDKKFPQNGLLSSGRYDLIRVEQTRCGVPSERRRFTGEPKKAFNNQHGGSGKQAGQNEGLCAEVVRAGAE